MGEHRPSRGTQSLGELTATPQLSLETGTLHGLVDVCVDRPLLALDRAFTYRVPSDFPPIGIGSMVKVPLARAQVRGWVLGPALTTPPRVLSLSSVVGSVRSFDEDRLAFLRRVADRAVAPLATIIDHASPPRVVSEESQQIEPPFAGPTPLAPAGSEVLATYRGGADLLSAIHGTGGGFVVQPGLRQESLVVVDAIRACLATGRTALVIVPEADPLPDTARALMDAFGEAVGVYLGGSKRARYRMWLDAQAGCFRCVVGTRSAVYLPLSNLGLIWVQRDAHPGHREERSPSLHVRDIARARVAGSASTLVLAGRCVSVEAVSLGFSDVAPAGRSWPPVEVVAPGPEGRAPRLVRSLKEVRDAFLFEPRRGYGFAAVCRSCASLAACAVCGGALRAEDEEIRCVACEAPGRCGTCGGVTFGLRRGGRERVEEWVGGIVGPDRVVEGRPVAGKIAVGGAPDVREVAVDPLDLVGILDADFLLSRTGIGAEERALAIWMEASQWAREDGRVVVQTVLGNAPAVQSLVAGSPARFHRAERTRRAEAGFPVGAPVFRVEATAAGVDALKDLSPLTLLEGGGSAKGRTVCLVALRPDAVHDFGAAMRALAVSGEVSRVDAEPHW